MKVLSDLNRPSTSSLSLLSRNVLARDFATLPHLPILINCSNNVADNASAKVDVEERVSTLNLSIADQLNDCKGILKPSSEHANTIGNEKGPKKGC